MKKYLLMFAAVLAFGQAVQQPVQAQTPVTKAEQAYCLNVAELVYWMAVARDRGVDREEMVAKLTGPESKLPDDIKRQIPHVVDVLYDKIHNADPYAIKIQTYAECYNLVRHSKEKEV